VRSQSSASLSIPQCPKCHQEMSWHSSHQTNYGALQATVFYCKQCERYVAESSEYRPFERLAFATKPVR
jgi:uncharacterized CHY-type Zn-finger protein